VCLHLFAPDYIKTWLRPHRCASDAQIRTSSQKSIVKQVDPVWKKSLQAKAHFMLEIFGAVFLFA